MNSAAEAPIPLAPVDRGDAGRVLQALRAQDFVFTVLECESTTAHYRRIRFAGNGFLEHYLPYPTMWVRLWFADETADGAGHQRAYTLVDPDVSSGTFWLEFALHDGAAARWANSVVPGQQIEASLYGSEPTLPGSDDVDAHVLVGDTASLPAINSILPALGPAPSVVVLEWVHDDDRTLPVRVRPGDRVRWVRRSAEQETLAAVRDELDALLGSQDDGAAPVAGTLAPTRVFAWGACDTVTTRALTKLLRSRGLRRDRVKTLGYWLPPQETSAQAE